PSDDSRLRTAEEFIAAEANKIGAAFQHLGRGWLMLGNSQRFSGDDRAAAKIFDKRNPVLLCQHSDLVGRWRFYKTAHEKIAAVDFQNHGGFWSNGVRVIFECSLVSRADFAQFPAAHFENFVDAKSAADLHQF